MLDWDVIALRIARAYKVSLGDVRTLLSLYPERVCAVCDAVIIFIRLNDEDFKLLCEGFYDITKPEVLFPLFKCEGENLHIISCVGNGASNILRLRDFFHCKTASWYRPDMSKLVIFNRR